MKNYAAVTIKNKRDSPKIRLATFSTGTWLCIGVTKRLNQELSNSLEPAQNFQKIRNCQRCQKIRPVSL